MATTAPQSQRAAVPSPDVAPDRPAYQLAAVAFAMVLAGYVFSLAPTVTFWDAGEFIATSHILGIPHPPGTPLYVIVGHTWDALIPGLPTGYKMNLMSAVFSSASAGLFFLFVFEALKRGAKGMAEGEAKLFTVGGAFAATLCSAFAFSVWQVSNDSGKVYPIAMFLIALSVWLAWLWRRERGGPRGAHILLLIVYILGLALANHLIGLLGGPALFAFMYHALRSEPSRLEAEQRVQWAQLFVMVALWIALVGLSMGSTGKPILIIGLVLYVAAAAYAFTAGTGLFGVVALFVAALGLSTYTFLYLRAGMHPFVNEADASTLRNLWAVIGREQYPPRGLMDNPIYPSGADNPGRTLQLLGLQILNWYQYFDWQWASSLMHRIPQPIAVARLPFTLLFIGLGVLGASEMKKWDESSFRLIGVLFLTTSIGLVVYLNFKPGFSLASLTFPDREAHEVRERDYFFTISYLTWGLWAGLGVMVAYRRLRERLADQPWSAAAPVLLLALLPVMLNFKAANRRFGPAATLARDFAYDMLIGVEPYGLLITNGDNDTFPLWYLQEVEGVRQDVMVVNLSLVNTDWYIRQLRDNPQRPYQPDANATRLYGATAAMPQGCTPQWLDSLNVWADHAKRHRPDMHAGPPMCLHTIPDPQIDVMQPLLLAGTLHFEAGRIRHDYPANTPMYIKDIMVLRLIQENLGKRPIYFALTAGIGNRMGLDGYLLQEGFDFKLMPDSVQAAPGRTSVSLLNSMVDIERTRVLAWDVYRYARLFDVDSLRLDPTDDNIASNLGLIFLTLGDAYRQLGDMPHMIENYKRAGRLSPSPELQNFLRQVEQMTTVLPGPDTSRAAPGRAPAAGQDNAKAGGRGSGGARGSSKGR